MPISANVVKFAINNMLLTSFPKLKNKLIFKNYFRFTNGKKTWKPTLCLLIYHGSN